MIELDDLPAVRPLPAATRSAQRRALEAAIVTRPLRRTRRWTSPVALAGVGAAVVVSTAAGYVTYDHFAAVTDTSMVRCYSNTNQGLGSDFNGSDTSYLSTGPDDPAPSALEQCAALWRAGIINSDSANASGPDRSVHSVPPLVVCVIPGGIAGVFPGTDAAKTCGDLKLPVGTGN